MKLSIKMRVAVVFSVLWVLAWTVQSWSYDSGLIRLGQARAASFDLAGFVAFGLFPLAVAWGAYWIAQGKKAA